MGHLILLMTSLVEVRVAGSRAIVRHVSLMVTPSTFRPAARAAKIWKRENAEADREEVAADPRPATGRHSPSVAPAAKSFKRLQFNPSVPESLICVGSRWRQIDAFQPSRRDCTRLRHRRTSWMVAKYWASAFLSKFVIFGTLILLNCERTC